MWEVNKIRQQVHASQGNNGGTQPPRSTDTDIRLNNLCHNSFSEETTVATANGDIAIADIRIGDLVLAYDERTGEIGEYTVTATISHIDPEIILLTIDGEWIDAGELTVGVEIMALDGDYGIVEAVVVLESNQRMYNLTVNGIHTFFVGDGAWLVHNTYLIIVSGQTLFLGETQSIEDQKELLRLVIEQIVVDDDGNSLAVGV